MQEAAAAAADGAVGGGGGGGGTACSSPGVPDGRGGVGRAAIAYRGRRRLWRLRRWDRLL